MKFFWGSNLGMVAYFLLGVRNYSCKLWLQFVSLAGLRSCFLSINLEMLVTLTTIGIIYCFIYWSS